MDRLQVTLLGPQELARELRMTTRAVLERRRRDDFPRPFAYVGGRPVWTHAQVVEYARARVRTRVERRALAELAGVHEHASSTGRLPRRKA